MISVEQADATIAETLTGWGRETRPITLLADRVLAEDVTADRDQPSFDRVTMDGIAFASEAWKSGTRSFPIDRTQGAGARPLRLLQPDHCVEIMTGAALSPDCDCVVPVECIDIDAGIATLHDGYEPVPYRNVHRRGTDYTKGTPLLTAGTRLRGTEVAILASVGKARAYVAKQPTIAVISTGDELVDVDRPVTDFQIRRSNDMAIVAALARARIPAGACVHLRDDPAELTRSVGELLAEHQVLVLSGGISMGKYDYIPGVLKNLGVEVLFHKVSQRPGKPMWFGLGPQGQAVFALPGNPVSTLTCLRRYVLPAIDKAMGAAGDPTFDVALSEQVQFDPELTWFLPVRLKVDGRATVHAEPRPTNTSGDFASLRHTDGFIQLDGKQTVFPQGTVARFYPW